MHFAFSFFDLRIKGKILRLAIKFYLQNGAAGSLLHR